MLKPSDLDRNALRRQAARRAQAVVERDFIAREIERRMLERLELIRLAPARMLDIGCGRAPGASALQARFPMASYLGIDLSPLALRRATEALPQPGLGARAGRWLAQTLARRPEPPPTPLFVSADTHRLPLPGSCADLIWSNLAWHGFADPLAVLAEWYRVIRPNGLLMFSAFGVDSLRDLLGKASGLPIFPDMHDIGDALVHAGFAEPVMDAERITLGYRQPEDLLAEVRVALGGNPLSARRRGLVGRARYREWLAALAARRGPDGLIAVDLELIQGHAWCPPRKRLPEGLAPISFMPGLKRSGGLASPPATE
jgi:malonyl-CoA O-methyltransferase